MGQRPVIACDNSRAFYQLDRFPLDCHPLVSVRVCIDFHTIDSLNACLVRTLVLF